MRAFTLIELMCVLGILTVLLGGAAWTGASEYRRVAAQSEVDQIMLFLRRARVLAMTESCREAACHAGTIQSVRITSDEIALLDADVTYERIPLSGHLQLEPTEISFLPQSGDVKQPVAVRIDTGPGKVRILSVSRIGSISIH
ncbi:MAG TPA: prepilin-type N-terminal cleavage/methylation domain-containing protein [Candidatus Paceibacterota bacterium]